MVLPAHKSQQWSHVPRGLATREEASIAVEKQIVARGAER